MRSIPVELQAEMLEEVVQVQHLFTIVTPVYVYRWTDGQNSVYYNGNWWVAKGIIFDNLNSTITGQLDSITLDIDNADKAFSDLALSTNIRGSQCIIELVYLNINQAVIGTPIMLFQGFFDRMPIDRAKGKVECFSHMIRWKLATPRRQHTPSCPWVFREPNSCRYVGEMYRNPTSDILAGFTRSHFLLNFMNVDDRLDDLCIGGTFTADSYASAGYEVDKAFDRDTGTYWYSANTAPPHWVKVQFAVAKIINRVKITQLVPGYYSPMDFSFEGSNDGSTWIELDNRNGVNWTAETYKVFEIANTTAYLYYRLYITKNPAYVNYSVLKELELKGPNSQVNDSDYNYTTNTVTKADVFGFPGMNMAPDATVASVTVRTRAKQTSAAARNIAGRLRVNDVDYDASAISPATSFTNYDFVWTQNPGRSVAWKPGDLSQVSLCVGGTPLADTEYAAGYEATKAFDDLFATYWMTTNSAMPHWLRYQLSVAKTVYAYSIKASFSGNYDPKDFKLQGSPNGTTWYDLDTRTGITFAAEQKKYFQVASPTSYLYYRLYITAVQTGTTYATVEEFELFEYDVITGFGYSTPANAGGNRVDISECYLKVNSNVVSCNLSPERCIELNNHDNFGGFEFITELQTKEFWWGSKQKVFGGGL